MASFLGRLGRQALRQQQLIASARNPISHLSPLLRGYTGQAATFKATEQTPIFDKAVKLFTKKSDEPKILAYFKENAEGSQSLFPKTKRIFTPEQWESFGNYTLKGATPEQIEELVEVVTPLETAKANWASQTERPKVQITIEFRDFVQSFLTKLIYTSKNKSDWEKHVFLANLINKLEEGHDVEEIIDNLVKNTKGDDKRLLLESLEDFIESNKSTTEETKSKLLTNIIASIVGGGGTWGQLPKHDNGESSYTLTESFVSVGKNGIPQEELQRGDIVDALKELSLETILAHLREKVRICKENGKQYHIRGFHFANAFQGEMSILLQAIEIVRKEHPNSILLGLEHSMKPEMDPYEVASTIFMAALRGEIKGGIKAFATNIFPDQIVKIIEVTDKYLKIAANAAHENGDLGRAKQLEEFAITVHSHLAKGMKDGPDKIAKEATRLGRNVNIHGTPSLILQDKAGKDFQFSTHYPISGKNGIIAAMEKYGIAVNHAQKTAFAAIERLHQEFLENHKQHWVSIPTELPDPSNKPGGGVPAEANARKQLLDKIKLSEAGYSKLKELAKESELTEQEQVDFLFNKACKRIEKEVILTCWVTPAKKAVDEIASMTVENELAGRDRYDGSLSGVVIQVGRKQPENIKDQEFLQKVYRQKQHETLANLVAKKLISEEQSEVIKEKLIDIKGVISIDKEALIEFLTKENIREETKIAILDASGQKFLPNDPVCKWKNAERAVDILTSSNIKLKTSEEIAVLTLAVYGDLGFKGIIDVQSVLESHPTVMSAAMKAFNYDPIKDKPEDKHKIDPFALKKLADDGEIAGAVGVYNAELFDDPDKEPSYVLVETNTKIGPATGLPEKQGIGST